MTALKCSAIRCAYNKEQLCSKGCISVAGESAKSAEETCCDSFRERGEGSALNAIDGCGCDTINVDCKAHNCTYNQQCKCTASAIQVDGSSACHANETKCNTFNCK